MQNLLTIINNLLYNSKTQRILYQKTSILYVIPKTITSKLSTYLGFDQS